MAGDWIKIRASLIHSPKVIAMGEWLNNHPPYLIWCGGGRLNATLRLRVTLGALVSAWASARAFGKRQENGDCLLPFIDIEGIDSIVEIPGFGSAMESVGWARYDKKLQGVILPKFFLEMNVEKSNAERAKAYRDRKKAEKAVSKPPKKPSAQRALASAQTSRQKRREDIDTSKDVSISDRGADTSADGPGVATAAGPPRRRPQAARGNDCCVEPAEAEWQEAVRCATGELRAWLLDNSPDQNPEWQPEWLKRRNGRSS